MSKVLSFLIGFLLVVYISLLYSQKIFLVNADLGRHIRNGETLLKDYHVLFENYYSYTNPHFPVVNHHWLSGLLLYAIWYKTGFVGVSLVFTAVSVAAVIFFATSACLKGQYKLVVPLLLISAPLLATRVEVRPEVFSYLFLGIFTLLLLLYREGKIGFRVLALLTIIIQILWVNLHLFFIFGPLLVTFFALDSLIVWRNFSSFKRLALLVLILLGAACVNPYGIKAVLAPINIFKNYGYMIVENQSPIFLQKLYPRFSYFYLELLFILSAVLFIYKIKDFDKKVLVLFALQFFFGILAFKYMRTLPVFAMFFIVYMCWALGSFVNNSRATLVVEWVTLVYLILSLGFKNTLISPINNNTGWGLAENTQNSAVFYIENNIKGPVFNNYDIGSYLIFNLGEGSVFIDNRPEAYPADFFKKVYIPAQENEEIWNSINENYGFNTIYFYRRDMTPWAQPFLINRINDVRWAPVYVDDYTIILLKRIQENNDIIQRYELPKSLFVFTKG